MSLTGCYLDGRILERISDPEEPPEDRQAQPEEPLSAGGGGGGGLGGVGLVVYGPTKERMVGDPCNPHTDPNNPPVYSRWSTYVTDLLGRRVMGNNDWSYPPQPAEGGESDDFVLRDFSLWGEVLWHDPSLSSDFYEMPFNSKWVYTGVNGGYVLPATMYVAGQTDFSVDEPSSSLMMPEISPYALLLSEDESKKKLDLGEMNEELDKLQGQKDQLEEAIESGNYTDDQIDQLRNQWRDVVERMLNLVMKIALELENQGY